MSDFGGRSYGGKDDLGRQMKRDYEDAFRFMLPRRGYTILRVDGRAFHTFTRNLERPYDRRLAAALDYAALALCREMTGCRFAFGQSDEYSFLLTDFEAPGAALWFDGNIQKMVSVSASLFGAMFNRDFQPEVPAAFDARVMVIGQPGDVAAYFNWRQLDASANSLNMFASAHYSHQELLGKSTSEKHELLYAKGLNWAAEPSDFKRGRIVRFDSPGGWIIDGEIPVFQREPGYLSHLIPVRQSTPVAPGPPAAAL